MPHIVDVEGIGEVEFPDDMTDAEIQAAIESGFAPQERSMFGKAAGLLLDNLYTPEQAGRAAGRVLGQEHAAVAKGGVIDAIKAIPDVLGHLLNPETAGATLKGAASGMVQGTANLSSPASLAGFAGIPGGPLGRLAAKGVTGANAAFRTANLADAGASMILGAKGAHQAYNDPTAGGKAAGIGQLALGAFGVLGAAPNAIHGMPTPQFQGNIPRLQQLETQRAIHSTNLSEKPGIVARIRRQFVNQFAPIEDMVTAGMKQAQPGTVLPNQANPANVAEVVAGGQGGLIEVLKMDVEDILKEAKKAGVAPVLGQFLDLKGMQHGLLTLASKGPQKAAKVMGGKAMPVGYTPADVLQDIDDLKQQTIAMMGPDAWQKVEDLAQRQFALNRQALDRTHESGIIGDDLYKELTERGDDYIPMSRIIAEIEDQFQKAPAFSGLDLKSQNVLHSIEGSRRPTVPAIESSFARNQEVIKEIGRNEIGRSVAELRQVDPVFKNLIFEVAPGYQARQGEGLIGYFDGGVRHTFVAPKAVADVLNRANEPEKLLGYAVFRGIRDVSQAFMTTWNAGFAVANVMRDFQDMRALSPEAKRFLAFDPRTWVGGVKDIKNFIGEYADVLKLRARQAPEYRHFLESRAGYSTLQKNLTPEVFQGGDLSALQTIFAPIAKVSSALEEAPKIVNFRRAEKRFLAKGLNPEEAAFEAALETRRTGGSPDFGRRGTHSALMNQLVIFFNAQVQGTARNVHAVTKNPKAMLAVAGSAAVSSLVQSTWNDQFTDPDGTPSIKRVSEKERQNNFIIFIPGQTYRSASGVERNAYVKIPKGHIGKLIHNPIEQALSTVFEMRDDPSMRTAGNVARAGVDTALDFASNIVPGNFDLQRGDLLGSMGRGAVSSVHPVGKLAYELPANTDTYRNLPIDPRRMEGLSPTQRYQPLTSETLKGVAKAVQAVGGPELSPLQLQHAVRSFFPGMGEGMLSGLDALMGQRPPVPLEGVEKVTNLPLVGPVARRILPSGIDQQDADRMRAFYKVMEKAKTINNDASALTQRGKVDEAKALIRANRPLLNSRKALEKVGQDLAELRHAREQLLYKPPADIKPRLERLAAKERMILQRIEKKIAPFLDN